jgi:hypothetical protein
MQTFLTSGADFVATARALDGARLRKQGVECYQILRALAGESKGWVNHPATKMWRGHEHSLTDYTIAIYDEIATRGWKADNIKNVMGLVNYHFIGTDQSALPPWIDDYRILATHRASLFRKAPEAYPQWSQYTDLTTTANRCCERCNYYWPTHRENKDYRWSLDVERLM